MAPLNVFHAIGTTTLLVTTFTSLNTVAPADWTINSYTSPVRFVSEALAIPG